MCAAVQGVSGRHVLGERSSLCNTRLALRTSAAGVRRVVPQRVTWCLFLLVSYVLQYGAHPGPLLTETAAEL